MSGVNLPPRYTYEYVPVGQSNQTMGGVGAVGDYLHRLVVSVDAPATANISLKDGPTVIPLLAGAAGVGRGVFSVEVNAASRNGPWQISTGAGVSLIAVGFFSP